MEFKFDTKTTYTIITPVADVLDVNLTENLEQKITSYNVEGANNFVVDLKNCSSADNKSFSKLAELHGWCYENARSLVFTGVCSAIMSDFQQYDMTESLNIAPTYEEAADIISMEILERDLMAEGDDLPEDF